MRDESMGLATRTCVRYDHPMASQRRPQQSARSGDLVMQQSLALRAFLGARAKRRAVQKTGTVTRTPKERTSPKSSGPGQSSG